MPARNRLLIAAVNRLDATDGTDLLLALQKSYDQIKKKSNSSMVNRILFLSDGQDANSITSLQKSVELCRQAGIQISTVGLGDDHDEEKMVAIEEPTGGDFCYARDPLDVAPFFKQQMQRMMAMAVSGLVLQLTPSLHINISELLNDDYHFVRTPSGRAEKGDAWSVDLHDMSRADVQSLIFRVQCAHGIAGEFRIAHTDLSYKLTDGGPGTTGQDIVLTYTSDQDAVRSGRNVEVLRRREELNVANVLTTAMTQVKQGTLSGSQAAQQLDAAAAQLARYGNSSMSGELTKTIHKLNGGDTSSDAVKTATHIATKIKRGGS